MAFLQGTATALIAPFKDDKVDFDSLARLLDDQLKSGIDALIINGTTGEPTTMTHSERTAVAECAIQTVGKRIPVILGAGSNNTYTAIEYAMEAERLGADGVLAVTPYYNKATQNGVLEHFKAIADKINIPVVMYNVPGRTGVNLLPATIKNICGYRNIVGIKEASGSIDQMMEIKLLCGNSLELYSGDDGLTFPCLAVGGSAVISVASNIVPRYMTEMTDAFFNGQFEKARDMQLNILPLVKALFCEVNPIPVKTAAALMGLIDSDYMRLPMTKMEKVSVLTDAMRAFGIQF